MEKEREEGRMDDGGKKEIRKKEGRKDAGREKGKQIDSYSV